MTTAGTSPITSIMADNRCVGFLFRRGPAGVEAFDEHRSLGLFADQAEAVAAVAVTARPLVVQGQSFRSLWRRELECSNAWP
jgi:hypothetical protein